MDKKDYKKNKWIEIENQGIKDIIVNNVDKMLSINDDLFLNNFMDIDVLTSDDITFFDKYDNITTYDTEGVAKNGEHWEKMTDEYINILNNRLKQNLNNLSKDEFKKVLSDYYKEFRKRYIIGLKISAIDLADKNVRQEYAKRQTEIIANMQTQEINNIGLKKFCKINLDETPYKFTYYTSIENLKLIQKHNINILKLIEEELKKPNKKTPSKVSIDTPKTNNKKRKPPHRQVLSYMETLILKDQQKVVDKMYEDSKDFYDKRHKKYLEIDKLINKVIKKYKKYSKYLENTTDNNKDLNIIEKMQLQNKNLESAKFNTTLLSNKLFTGKDIESGTPYQFSFKEKTSLEDITTSITIYDSESNIIQLSKEHRDINDAVGSLLDNGKRYLTLKQLYNFINKGIISNDPVDQDKIDELLKDLYKMDKKTDIDATEQFKLRGYQEYLQEYEKKTGIKPRPIISQNLINFKIYKNVPHPNGELMDIICFMDYPAIYDYARQYRQLAPYPVEILNLNYSPHGNKKDNTIQINDITRTIRNELIRCIELRKSGINQPLVINNFLCTECQFYDVIDKNIIDKNKIHTKILNKQKRVRYANNIEIILNNFKDKGYIKGYKINKLGKVNKYSITFTFNKDN